MCFSSEKENKNPGYLPAFAGRQVGLLLSAV
jgi:hypothetical protein